jgi:hypothetical protein
VASVRFRAVSGMNEFSGAAKGSFAGDLLLPGIGRAEVFEAA